MPPASTKGSLYPPNDVATYRDLLLFEERLKTNSANLQRRKSRYQLFLFQLLLVIAFLLCEVLLPPQRSLLVMPYRALLQRVLPEIYTANREVTLHPYIASGLLFVSVTTLVLFFASGMYSDKIAYANKYVPHANRALRSFNMSLNVRRPPFSDQFRWNPLRFFFPRPEEASLSTSSRTITSRTPSRSLSPSSPNRPRSSSTALPIPTIPPAANPRGEIIFSSRIDKNLRESYERYRNAFEKRRQEKEYLERRKTWYGKLMFWDRPPTPVPGSAGLEKMGPSRTISNASSRGRGSRSGTPSTMPGTPAVRGSPSPSSASGSGIVMKQRGIPHRKAYVATDE